MKRLIPLLLIIIVLISGCAFFQKKEEVPSAAQSEISIEKKIGLVSTSQDQGLLTAPSPFLLISDSGEKTFLASLSVNLKRYLKRRVEVEGNFNEASAVFEVQNVASLGNETLVKSDFNSTDFGLKFQYPSVWVLKETKNAAGETSIQIAPYEVSDEEILQVDRIAITRTENNKRLAVREWLNLDEQYRSKDPLETGSIFQQSSISATNLEAVKKTTGDRIDFYVGRDTYIYVFSHVTQNDSDFDLYRNAFYNLVQSFEFIPFSKAAQSSSVAQQTVAAQTPAATISELATEELAKRKLAEDKRLADAAVAERGEALSVLRKQFIDYITANIFELSGEPQQMATGMKVLEIAFANPQGQPDAFSAIYVTYRFGNPEKKMVLQVFDIAKPETMKRAGVYAKGETVDWKLIDGEDPAKGSEKTVISLVGDTAPLTILKGMTLLDAKAFKIKIQYPSNMYWRYQDELYIFSSKSNEPRETAEFILSKNPETLPQNIKRCAKYEDNNYCLTGLSDAEPGEVEIKMLGTINEY